MQVSEKSGFFVRCTGVEEVVKASVYSAEIASSYIKTQIVSIMSTRCPMKSCQRIIRQIEGRETDPLVQHRSGRRCVFLLSQVPRQAQPLGASFLSKAQGKVQTVRSSVVRKQATWSQPAFDNNEADFIRAWPVEEVYQPLCSSNSNHEHFWPCQ